jgi:hypothetical protein
MLGGKGPLSDIPQRVGYDRALLGVETLDGQTFTLVRSTEGGAFRVFDGLHVDVIPDSGDTELADQHNERRDDNLSTFLLSKIELSHKRVRRNKRGDTQNLTIRSLARLLIVNEEEIIQKRSPLSDGNYAADPANTAIFKLLLTGTDDRLLERLPGGTCTHWKAPPFHGARQERTHAAQQISLTRSPRRRGRAAWLGAAESVRVRAAPR